MPLKPKPGYNLSGCLAGIAILTLTSLAPGDEVPAVVRVRAPAAPPTIALLPEFRPIGGGGNNLVHPGYDPVPGSPEIALAPLNFVSGTTSDMVDHPNPRVISNLVAGGTGAKGENSETLDPTNSAWLYAFGQFVDHDLDLESTPQTTDRIDITVPDDDPDFDPGTSIEMNRDERDPTTNTIVNTVAGYLDLSQLYGSTQDVADDLRNPDGTLVSSDNGQALPVVDDQFVSGDVRVMENPELTTVTTLFMREHNYWVGMLKAQHPDWTGDQLYNMAKAITTGEYQNIIYKEYLPALIGKVVPAYRGYNPNVNPQITQEFSTAAFRVGHSQVSGTQTGVDNRGRVVFSQNLADTFFNTPEIDEANGFDAQMRSMSEDAAQSTDVYTIPELRNLLFADLVGGDVDEMDLIAIDIQREYDVGIATLNNTRRALKMAPYRSFAQLTKDPVLQKSFQAIYGNIENVDLFMGGLAEAHVRGAVVGSTFQKIIENQFVNLRNGDRFYFGNQKFDKVTAAAIGNTFLTNLVKRNTDTTLVLQRHLFTAVPFGTTPKS